MPATTYGRDEVAPGYSSQKILAGCCCRENVFISIITDEEYENDDNGTYYFMCFRIGLYFLHRFIDFIHLFIITLYGII